MNDLLLGLVELNPELRDVNMDDSDFGDEYQDAKDDAGKGTKGENEKPLSSSAKRSKSGDSGAINVDSTFNTTRKSLSSPDTTSNVVQVEESKPGKGGEADEDDADLKALAFNLLSEDALIKRLLELKDELGAIQFLFLSYEGPYW